jgi:hypothetical protein
MHYILYCKGTGKFYPITGHESQEGEEMYSSSLSLTSALDGVGSQPRCPARERPGTPCIGGGVGPRGGLDGCGKSHSLAGFDDRTVQPVAGCYTDCVIPAHTCIVYIQGYS